MFLTELYFVVVQFIVLIIVFLFCDYKYKKNILKVYETFDLYFIRNNFNKKLYYLKKICIIIIIITISIGLYDFKTQKKIIEDKLKKKNFVILFDVSKSMSAIDVYPARITLAKLLAERLIKNYDNAEFSLISFAGKPVLQCVFTEDKDMFDFFLKNLNTGIAEVQGTDLGESLKKAYEIINDYRFKDSIIILITDGEDFNDNTYDILKNNYNIPVISVGIGTITGYNLEINDKTILTKLNEDHLKKISELTQGKYIKFDDYKSVLNKLDDFFVKYDTEIIEKKYTVYVKHYRWFILISFLFFSLWSIIKI